MQDRADPHARERASPSPVRIRRPALLRTRRSRRCGTCSLRSATPARSARPIAAGSERRETAPIRPSNSPKNWRAAYRAHTVGSDGHFVGFEPLTWQLHRDHPPPARPPSSPRRRRDRAENRGARAPVVCAAAQTPSAPRSRSPHHRPPGQLLYRRPRGEVRYAFDAAGLCRVRFRRPRSAKRNLDQTRLAGANYC
jgi:hypothetical protein